MKMAWACVCLWLAPYVFEIEIFTLPSQFWPSARLQQIKNWDNGEEKMPKIKTNRSAAKRFKITGTGKIVFAKSHRNHILTKKTTKRKRSLRKSHLIDKTNKKVLSQLLHRWWTGTALPASTLVKEIHVWWAWKTAPVYPPAGMV